MTLRLLFGGNQTFLANTSRVSHEPRDALWKDDKAVISRDRRLLRSQTKKMMRNFEIDQIKMEAYRFRIIFISAVNVNYFPQNEIL